MASKFVGTVEEKPGGEEEEQQPRQRNARKKVSRGSATVSFQPRPSYYSLGGEAEDFDGDQGPEGEDSDRIHIKGRWWRFFIENKRARQVFRLLHLLNLFLLAASAPLASVPGSYSLAGIQDLEQDNCSEPEYLSDSFRRQFIVITVLDFVLAVLFTAHLVLRFCYAIYLREGKPLGLPSAELEGLYSYTDWFRISRLTVITLSLWWSVGIGIYRSNAICIDGRYYWGFVARAISILSVLRLVVTFRVNYSALKGFWNLFKWKQLAFVTLFYFIFVFLFALIGVHWIGSLDNFCVYRSEPEAAPVLAFPFTHCMPDASQCGANGSGFSCEPFFSQMNNSTNTSLNFNFRNQVYYGQFRVILDALFAVYEASTLELWSYMMYNSILGDGPELAIIFYGFLIIFLVILLQQSLFLVVIIESFSLLRSESSLSYSRESKTKSKPLTVLKSGSDNRLYLQSCEGESYSEFLRRKSRVLTVMEKFFLAFIAIDAVMLATKTNSVDDNLKLVLQVWQVAVSIAFLLEVIILFFFHLVNHQLKGFFHRPYYLCLIVLAVGGVVAAVPYKNFYDPTLPANGLVIFQALRVARLLRVVKPLREFYLKIMGSIAVPLLCIITVVAILWLAVVNMQFFGYFSAQPDCQRVGGGHFDNIMSAFLSTFQLVMNEAWTDMTSEAMCRRPSWFVRNFYFIGIHLFSSLIFLNFFGAVILDNLEYDDEVKQQKLEELEKPKQKTVPWHLKIFKYNQPKLVRPPVATGFEGPHIEEVELRRFFESGGGQLSSGDITSHEFSSSHPLLTQPTPQPHLQRRQSELSQLGLVSRDSVEFISSETPVLQGKYHSISAILNYAKVFRQHSEDQRTKNAKESFGRAFITQSDTSPLVQGEYDEFREKHHFFDMALFCMPPEHRLRRFCTFLLNAQLKPPQPVGKPKHIMSLILLNLRYYFLTLVSRLPYITWVMLLVVMGLIVMHIEEYSYTERVYKYYIPLEVIYLVIMLSWLVLKILANGVFLNPNAAIKSLWDVLDWIIVLDSLIVLILVPVWANIIKGAVVEVPFRSLWMKVFLVVRALRPLHAISILPFLRRVVRELVEGWRNLLLGTVIMFGFIFMFASLGVQLFTGTEYSPQAFCNDPTITNENECVGEFVMKLRISRELLASDNNPNEILVPRVWSVLNRSQYWFPFARDYRFENIGTAMLTLFYLLTLEGWVECRDLFDDRNTPGADKAYLYMLVYIHFYVFLAVNLFLQLLLGVVVNNFNEHKANHSFLLTVQQSRWTELLQRIALQRPYKLPPEPRNNLRRGLYRLLINHNYRIVPTVIHILNAFTLVVPWDLPHTGKEPVAVCISLSIVFNFYSIIELLLKLVAFGPRGYFQSWRNMFDMFLAVCSAAYIVFAIIFLSFKDFENQELLKAVTMFALIVAVLKCFTVLIKYSAMLNLLLTILNTLIKSIPLISVVFVILVCYSLVGVVLFSNVRSGEAMNYSFVNFRSSSNALMAVWRSLTGEDWYQIMWDLAVEPPYCSESAGNCGNLAFSVLYFFTFTLLVPFILINVFIGVLLENFSLFYNDDDTNLSNSDIKDFKRKWSLFDTNASGHIPASRLKLLLRTLEQQQYYTYCTNEKDGVRERTQFNLTESSLLLWEMAEELKRESSVPSKSTSTASSSGAGSEQNQSDAAAVHHSFQTVLRMLAYRVEDIHVRLEPKELFAREDLENNIQIDVAEQCILKWLKKIVKPLVQKQQQESAPEASSGQRQHAGDRSKLLSLHNMRSQLLNVQSWHNQPSLETEDEDTLPHYHRHSFISPTEEQVDFTAAEEVRENPLLTASYDRLAHNASQSSHNGQQEKQEWAQEWLQLQQEWMEKIGEDDNYFDDHL